MRIAVETIHHREVQRPAFPLVVSIGLKVRLKVRLRVQPW